MLKDRWQSFSKAQQLGNIGSEISRAIHWESKNDRAQRNRALERALELLDLTLDDKRWDTGLKEIARFREVAAAWFYDDSLYGISPTYLKNYCIEYACKAPTNIKIP